jgi:hypothetical protein
MTTTKRAAKEDECEVIKLFPVELISNTKINIPKKAIQKIKNYLPMVLALLGYSKTAYLNLSTMFFSALGK